ncbi:MAG: ABC transporter substrate-binding protein [Flavobacteriales bacterium]
MMRTIQIGYWSTLISMAVFWASCTPSARKNNLPIAARIGHVSPTYAQGFDWDMLADSTYIITLFNLESPGDTLQVIHWKPRSIERIACLSTTHIPFIHALCKMNLLKGSGFADRTLDAEAKLMYERGELLNLTTGNELEPEVVFAINPDLLFVYPFGGKSYEKFLSNGIGCIQVSEYLERHPLGRAEWIRLFGCLLGEQQLADSIFKSIERPYLQLRDSLANVSADRPTVFAGSMDGDRWAVPSANSYLATLLRDAGGNYIFSDSAATGNLVLPFESFYAAANKATYWGKIIYETNPSSADVITQGDNRLKDITAFREKHVFVCNAMHTDYHGQALLEPARLLNDLHRILYSKDTVSQQYYFNRWTHYD